MVSKYANNPEYILNPKTNRYVRKTSQLGKKLMKSTSNSDSRTEELKGYKFEVIKNKDETAVFIKPQRKMEKGFIADLDGSSQKSNLLWIEPLKTIFNWKQGKPLYLSIREKHGEWRVETSSPAVAEFKINKFGFVEQMKRFDEYYRTTGILTIVNSKYNDKIKIPPNQPPFRIIDDYKVIK